MSIKFKYIFFSFICILLFAAVFLFISNFPRKSNNPEHKKYDSLLLSLKYKSYKTLSENTIPTLTLLYNTTLHAGETELSENLLRLLLGYSWAVSEKPDYAIAESAIINDISPDDESINYMAHSLAAIALYEKGWKSLAADKLKKGDALLKRIPKSNEQNLRDITFHMIAGSLCIYKENYQSARYHFAGFNLISGIRWPYLIADAMADTKKGNAENGLKKIKKVLKNPDTPEAVRKSLFLTLAKSEKQPEPVEAKLFWTKQISLALYYEIKNTPIQEAEKIADFLDNLRERLKIE